MRVDVHTHWLPPAFFELMEEVDASHELESYSVFGPMLRPGSERLFASGHQAVLDDWATQMLGSSVDLAVISLGALQPYFASAAVGVDAAHRANTMLAEAVEGSRGILGAFASLPLPHVDAGVREATHWLDAGFLGVNIGTSAGGRPLDAPEFDELWEVLNDREATVFIHPGTTPRMGVGATDYHLAPDFCSPTETALALCRLATGRVFTRYPRIKFIAAALGGSLPFFAHRFDAGVRKTHPGLYEEIGGVIPTLRRCWYDTSMLEEPRALDSVRHSLGIDRLVFGSDLPRGPLAEAVDFIASSPSLSAAERTQILDVNSASAVTVDRRGASLGRAR